MRNLTTTTLALFISGISFASDNSTEPAEAKTPRRASLVLVVDDDKVSTKMVAHWVRKKSTDRGIPLEVTTVNDPFEALQMAQDTKYDIVVTDLNMPGTNGKPGMNGDELARQIKKSSSPETSPRFILNTTEEDAETTFAGQFEGIVLKIPQKVASMVCAIARQANEKPVEEAETTQGKD